MFRSSVAEAGNAVDPVEAAAVLHVVAGLDGEDDAMSGTDEIAWSFRKLLEEQAPLVVCFDDVQWAEETFLDLLEHLMLLSRDAPILLLWSLTTVITTWLM